MAELLDVRKKPRYRVIRVVKDWETGNPWRGGDTMALTGAETRTFLPFPRWAESNGRIERIER